MNESMLISEKTEDNSSLSTNEKIINEDSSSSDSVVPRAVENNNSQTSPKYDHDVIASKYTAKKLNLKRFFHKKNSTSNIKEETSSQANELNLGATVNLPQFRHRVRLSSTVLSFSSLYYNRSWSIKILIIFLISLFNGFCSVILVQNTGLYTSGLSGVSQGIARLVNVLDGHIDWLYNLLFWVLIIIINIPLAIFGYFKVGKRFTILTVIYLVVSDLFAFALSFIPGISEWVIIGTRRFQNSNSTFMTWNDPSAGIGLMALLFSGILYSQFSAFVYIILFIIGGSTGGFDFFSVWYSKKKHKSIGKILTYVSAISMFFGSILGNYIGQCIEATSDNNVAFKDPNAWSQPNLYLFTPSLLVSLTSIVIQGFTINVFFPRFKWAKIEIFSEKMEEVLNIMRSDTHPHGISLYDITGGYSLKQRKSIVTVSLYLEIPRLLSLIRYVDAKCFVIISDIKNLDGYVYVYDNDISTSRSWKSLDRNRKNKTS